MLQFSGPHLRARRQDAGLTLRDLADQAVLDVGYISQLETGHRTNPSSDVIRSIAASLHCTPNDFFAEQDTP